MPIDFRSDTVTLPVPGMLHAMMTAQVGDDVFEEDPTVTHLEEMSAKLFGMEAALYCVSGTMSNQVAIRCHTRPGDELICEKQAHIYIYEGGGIAANSGVQVRAIEGDRGQISAKQVAAVVNPDDVHKAHTSLVCLENTSNRGGGSCYDFEEIVKIKKVCTDNHLSFHLDGARIFNAMVAKDELPASYGGLFDSISFCLNKGLGCPIGSMLVGKKDFIKQARRIRKVFGGGLRQAGYMAAAGIYALQHHVPLLEADHARAKALAAELTKKYFVKSMMPVETNIIIFEVDSSYTAKEIADAFKQRNILVIAISPTQVRFVTHLGISDDMMHDAISAIQHL
ncbi:MAG: PLP-dependent transferase [Bacteroidetes bacterium]|nr:PLP-dependent transferase [Bacteroidota bacterium]